MFRAAAMIVCFFLLLPAPAQADTETPMQAPPVGIILAVEGTGNSILPATKEGKATPAKPEAKIYPGDILQTGQETNARLLAVLIDGTQFTLGAGTKFSVSSYAYDDTDDRANMARFNIAQGAFLYTGGHLGEKDGEDVKITTPFGAIGVQGATLWGGALGSQFGIYVEKGEASLESRRGHTFLKEGQATALSGPTAIPERPHSLSEDIVAAAKATVALRNSKTIEARLAEATKEFPAMIALHKRYIHAVRLKKLDTATSFRRQGRGVLKIEQDRQDQRIGEKQQDKPATGPAPMAPKQNPPEKAPAPAASAAPL